MMASEFKFTIYYTKKEDLIEDFEEGGIQLSEGRAIASFTTDQTEEPIEKIKEKFDEIEIDKDDEEEEED